MSSTTLSRPRVLTDLLPGERVRDVLLTVGFTLAIALSAELYAYLPGNPVPLTAQTFVVLAGAVALGAGRAAPPARCSTSASARRACRCSPPSSGATLGYIVGFAVAGTMPRCLGLARRDAQRPVGGRRDGRRQPRHLRLRRDLVGDRHRPGRQVRGRNGVAPFLVGDAIKIAAAVAVLPTLWKLVAAATPDLDRDRGPRVRQTGSASDRVAERFARRGTRGRRSPSAKRPHLLVEPAGRLSGPRGRRRPRSCRSRA